MYIRNQFPQLEIMKELNPGDLFPDIEFTNSNKHMGSAITQN